MSDLDRYHFWSEFPAVRIVTIDKDGKLTGGEAVEAKHFGGNIPNIGDVIGTIWDNEEYDFQYVQQRLFIDEFNGPSYWLLVVRDGEPTAQFNAISTNALLVSDFEEAMKKAGRSKKARDLAEVHERYAQLHRDTGKRRFKPKKRPTTA